MIDKEKAINILNNMGEIQKGYLYRKQLPLETGFYFKPVSYKGVSSYCIIIYENYEKDLVEDIVFRNKEEMKYFMEELVYPPYFGEWTKEFGDKMLEKFPSLSIAEKTLWGDKSYNYIINKWGRRAIACYRVKKEN